MRSSTRNVALRSCSTRRPGRVHAGIAELTDVEVIGADRWLKTYREALLREDIRVAARVLLGAREQVVELIRWLITQGRAAVNPATHDLETLLDHTAHAPAACSGILHEPYQVLRERGIRPARTYETIPDRAERRS